MIWRNAIKRAIALVVMTASMTLAYAMTEAVAHASAAVTPPVKEIFGAYFGWEVDETKKTSVCALESGDKCKDGVESSRPGGFANARVVAGAPNGNIYVLDNGNARVQELEPDGKFVLMFGKKVDKTTSGDICTAISGHECQSGVHGEAPAQFSETEGLTVDSAGNVYVAERVFLTEGVGQRVQEFTSGGEFVLEIGKEVNKTTKGNVCRRAESEKGECGPSAAGPGSEKGAFDFASAEPNMLSAGGPEDLLYVGQKHGVQEFTAEGEWKGEIAVAGSASAVAVDGVDGSIALVENEGDVVRHLGADGELLNEFEVVPSENVANVELFVHALAFDVNGDLAVSVIEKVGTARSQFGGLYAIGTGRLITFFQIPTQAFQGVGFDSNGEMFAVGNFVEVLAYLPVFVAELTTIPSTCQSEPDSGTVATVECQLKAEVNPENVTETFAWFQWGTTEALGRETSPIPIPPGEVTIPVSTTVAGLPPSAKFYDRVVARDKNTQAPEILAGETLSFITPLVPPRIVGTPSAPFVRPTSAVMYGEMDPENANVRYAFEYAPVAGCERVERELEQAVTVDKCAQVALTPAEESATYGTVGATLEATGLQPQTSYRYRLTASNANDEPDLYVNERGEPDTGEGVFVTASPPALSAETGEAGSVGTTSATLPGSVDGGGAAGMYVFELGIYQGATTEYGVIASGAAPASATPAQVAAQIAGLQPGTEYAFRVKIVSPGHGEAVGAVRTFRTAGLPEVPGGESSPPMLPVPPISFPHEVLAKAPPRCRHGYARGKRGRCVKVKKRGRAREGKKAARGPAR
jgi:hypothetical protein